MEFDAVASNHPFDSSIVKSGVMTPDPPLSEIDAANFSTPYLSIGFQYVITTDATPVSDAVFNAANTSDACVPPWSEISAAS